MAHCAVFGKGCSLYLSEACDGGGAPTGRSRMSREHVSTFGCIIHDCRLLLVL